MAEEKPMALNRRSVPAVLRPPAATALTPRELFGILRRQMLWIIGLTIVGLIAGGATWFLLRRFAPKYTAKAYIKVLPPVKTDPMLILTPLLQRDILYGHRLSLANMIKQQQTLEALLKRATITNPDTGTEWFNRSMGRSTRKAVKYLDKYLGAYAHRDADFIEVSMTCRKPGEAATIANEAVTLFVSLQGGSEEAEIAKKLTQLEARGEAVENDLRMAEAVLDDIRKASGLTDIDTSIAVGRWNQHTFTQQLNQLELEKNLMVMTVRQLEAQVETFRELMEGPVTVQVEYMIERDNVMIVLAQQLAFIEARLAGVLSKFGPDHREVRQIQDNINEIRRKRELRAAEIAEQTRQANYKNAVDGLIVLQARLEELEVLRQEAKAKKKELDLARIQFERGVKIRDERITVLDEIKMQLEKLRIMHDDPETPKVRAIGFAPEPLEMVSSRQWWFWFPGGTIVGFLVSIALAFLIELANDLVRTPRDVAKHLFIPLLGVVPDADEDSQVRGVDLCHVVSQAPYSLISESYRRCRTNLKLSGTGASLKTLLVTSGSAGDGKTSVVVNLATAFVAEDKKVLLIDANFRRPNIEKLFPKTAALDLDVDEGIASGLGLSSVLMGQCSVQEAIRSSGIEGLDLIDAGLLPSNPTELLGSVRMAELLRTQRENYDYVLVDSPPVLLISDAKVLAKLVDGTVLVFNAAATKRGAAQRTIREMDEVDAKVLGCVLLGAPALKGGYFQEQFKSYRRYQQQVQFA